MSLFVWAVAMFGMAPVFAATNSGVYGASTTDLTGGPAVRSRDTVDYNKYETRTTRAAAAGTTYSANDGKNLYYVSPRDRASLYKEYDNSRTTTTTTTTRSVRTNRTDAARTVAGRKYYLAHPFYQPMRGDFGSVTDLSYSILNYDVDLFGNEQHTAVTGGFPSTGGSWHAGQFAVKEDISYGITDQIAVQAMLQYDVSDYKFKWDNAPNDTMDDSGLNVMGLGGQWRFLDTDEWIATASLYYQYMRDTAHVGVAEVKGGYKYNKSTFYGVARAWYLNLDGDNDSYGVGLTDGHDVVFIAYNTGSKNLAYIEGSVGAFTVLDNDWTLNLDATYGYYDWHNSLSLRGAIGWQPGDIFALNLYASTTLYDSADGKELKVYSSEPDFNWNALSGTAKVDGYRETKFGIQAILNF